MSVGLVLKMLLAKSEEEKKSTYSFLYHKNGKIFAITNVICVSVRRSGFAKIEKIIISKNFQQSLQDNPPSMS